jgi:gamma-glutamyltranspeptidase/glutathione hydrolase
MKKIILILILSLTILLPGDQGNNNSRRTSPLVVSYYRQAQEAGYAILKAGGNAFDAFVAVTAVENVLSSGEVTLAGLLSALAYHAGSDRVIYLDSGFNSVFDASGRPDPKDPVMGKWIMVPGVLAGLEAISMRHGRLAFSTLLEPAIQIARNGFPIEKLHAERIRAGAEKLKRSEYGRRTFFPRGIPLKPGDILKQPELADFLKAVARKGAAYMYRGEWARQCVETVKNLGGVMSRRDLAEYRPFWTEPWMISYRDFTVFSSSGRSTSGLWALLALKVLEFTDIHSMGHYSTSTDALEIMVKIAREVTYEKWTRDYRCLDNRELVNSKLNSKYASEIWKRIKNRMTPAIKTGRPEACTMSSVVADKEGNVVSGKHSINSELWGSGRFVQGVLLNSSGDNYGRFTGAGKRRIQGAPSFLVFQKKRLTYALGTYSFSNTYAAFQFLVNLLDFGLSPGQAVDMPRFGSFPINEKDWSVEFDKNWMDPRVSRKIVDELKKRGLYFSLKSPKLGKGCIAEFLPDGRTATGFDKTN